jgi:nitroreductase
MEAYEMITTRQSYRAFKNDPIPEQDMQKILLAASNSPSYTNTQPWEVAVVAGKKKDELSAKLVKLVKANAPTNPDVPSPASWPPQMKKRQQEHGARRLNILGVEREDKEGRERLKLMNFEFYGAPCAVFLFMDSTLGEWSIFDMGLFTQNLILAAHSLGVESCIQASVTDYAHEIKTHLAIAGDKKLLACLSMGYPDLDVKLNTYRSLKRKPEEFVTWYE